MQTGLIIFLIALVFRLFNLIFLDLSSSNYLYEDQNMYLEGSYIYPLKFWESSHAIVAERMPGVFWFYKILINLFDKNLFLILFAQSIIDSLTCVVISKSAKIVDHSLEKIVGFLAIVSPTMIITSSQILSDTLFMLFFSISIYYFLVTYYKKSFSSCFISSFALGLSTLVRAVSYPLVFLSIPILYICNYKNFGRKKIIICLLGFIIIGLLPLSPRIMHNVINYKTFALTSQTGTHLSYWVVPSILTVSNGYDRNRSIEIVNENIEKAGGLSHDPYKDSKIRTKVAIEMLLNEPFTSISYAWVRAAAINIFSPALLVDQRVRTLPHPSFINSGGVKEWFNLLVEDKIYYKYFVFLLLALLFSIISFFLIFSGFLIALNKNFLLSIFGIMLIVYFVVISGPNVSHKYALPFISVIFLWQAFAIRYFINLIDTIFIKKRKNIYTKKWFDR